MPTPVSRTGRRRFMESDQVHRTNRQHLVRPDLFRTRLFRNPPGREEVNEPSRAPLTLAFPIRKKGCRPVLTLPWKESQV